MPVSKKRKKKPGRTRPRRERYEVTRPVWEYRDLAEQLAAADPELTAEQILSILLHSPYRSWNTDRDRITTMYPSEVAAAAGVSLDEWLVATEEMAASGFLTWDADNNAHVMAFPTV